MNQRLSWLLCVRDNDYAKEAALFQEKTGVDIVTGYCSSDAAPSKTCSIVIPFFQRTDALEQTIRAICQQDGIQKSDIEIVIVNDGSDKDIRASLREIRQRYPVQYISLKKQSGRSIARNIGILYARNEVIICVDQDIVFPPHALENHLVRHEYISRCVIVGMRENITVNDLAPRRERLPNFTKDFRSQRFVPASWQTMYPDVPASHFNTEWKVLEETGFFRSFGNDTTVGVWQLPYMVLASNMSVAREHFIRVGGFDPRFEGWGMEDVHLGAKLIAAGLYIIPCTATTAYHLVEDDEDGKRSQKMQGFQENLKKYRQYKEEPVRTFLEEEWREHVRASQYIQSLEE